MIVRRQWHGWLGLAVWLGMALLSAPVYGESGSKPAARESSPDEKDKSSEKKKKGLWQRIKDGVARLVPEPIKRGWRKTKKKWNQTVRLVRAMRDLFFGDAETRRETARVQRKQLRQNRWRRLDRLAKARALRELRLALSRRACRHGSARACRRWAKLQPYQQEPLRLWQELLRRRKQWKPMLRVCRRLQKLVPQMLENQLCVTDAMRALRRWKVALALYQRLSERFPQRGVVWLEWGQLLVKRKAWKAAHRVCTTATQRMPKDALAWHCQGEALAGWKQNKQARHAFEKACSLGHGASCRAVLRVLPRSRWKRWWTWTRVRSQLVAWGVTRGTVWGSCKVGVDAACRRLARRAVAKAQRLIRYQRTGEALWWLRRATRYAPGQAKPWRALGLLLMKHFPSREACRCLQRSLQLNPKQAALWSRLGQCYERQAQSDRIRARKAYLRACRFTDSQVDRAEACRRACAHGAKAVCARPPTSGD